MTTCGMNIVRDTGDLRSYEFNSGHTLGNNHASQYCH